MKKVKLQRKILKFFLLTVLFLISHFSFLISNALASSEFSTANDFTYEVLESGLTRVTQKISLTNLTTNYYASEYSITFATDKQSFSSNKITNIKAQDNLGPLKPEISYPQGTTVIHVFFNEKVLGIKKTLKWQLSYDSTDIAKQEGKIWKINLPKAFKDEVPVSYNVKLIVPLTFGRPNYMSPKPKTDYFWTKEEKAQEGISLAFGNWQAYHFTLTSDLKNPHFLPETREMVLPKTDNSQEIILESLHPKPDKIISDEKGNWLARYFLWPRQNLKIKVQGYAKVFAYPFLLQGLTGQMESNFVSQIPEDLKNKFLIEKETSEINFWQKIWTTLFSKP